MLWKGKKKEEKEILYIYIFNNLDALIRDIRTDVEVAKKSLQRPAYEAFKKNELFTKQ